ncbi:MAG TPA: thiamine-phosphate kinase [Candidatus Dormibacteraeota bacterium]|nr:thiamine-phosphate kinase [Candidatus Dormibacteraeota bacterium]
MLSRYLDGRTGGLLVPAPEDDAAVWAGDRFVVGTVDTLVEGIDFRLDWPAFDWRKLGRRLMAINLSDLAAMGAEPRHALVSLCLRRDMRSVDVERLYSGIAQQATRFGSTIAGGDLSATRGPLTLTATLIGRVPSAGRLLKRTGARPGWQVAVTGTLAGAAAGLGLLESRRSPRTKAERDWVTRQLDPQPRIAAGLALVRTGVRVAGDISDGLYRELEKLTQPGMGATIDVDRLPLASGLGDTGWKLALQESEDFELVCAAPPATMRKAAIALAGSESPLTTIGTIDSEHGIRLRRGGRPASLERVGYQHFR